MTHSKDGSISSPLGDGGFPLGDGGFSSGDGGYKTLFLIRHAKSSWEAAILSDFERPLNERGKKDAPEMAARLKDKKFIINAFVSSPAKRAKKTAELFCEQYEVAEKSIHFIPELYHAHSSTFFNVVAALDDQYNNVAIFSHNPGITEFVNMLTNTVEIDNMPTCGIFGIKVFTHNWADFKAAKKEFLLFDYPKNR
jgi:phosphohistidine phosphatase